MSTTNGEHGQCIQSKYQRCWFKSNCWSLGPFEAVDNAQRDLVILYTISIPMKEGLKNNHLASHVRNLSLVFYVVIIRLYTTLPMLCLVAFWMREYMTCLSHDIKSKNATSWYGESKDSHKPLVRIPTSLGQGTMPHASKSVTGMAI